MKSKHGSTAQPTARSVTAGYSKTPLPKKLGIKSNTTVALVGAPAGWAEKFEPLLLESGLENVRLTSKPAKLNQTILLFSTRAADLKRRLPGAIAKIADPGALWLVWPKQTSGMQSDLGERQVREIGLATGWVDYKVCAVDETWSGLCFARRRENAKAR